jgi:hypothetical protein
MVCMVGRSPAGSVYSELTAKIKVLLAVTARFVLPSGDAVMDLLQTHESALAGAPGVQIIGTSGF